MMNSIPTFSVSDFVAVFNQTLEFAYPGVTILGELANFRLSKNRWVYFSLKDEYSSVDFFGSVLQLPGPLEEGMMLEVVATPRLHNQYGFKLNVISLKVSGTGSIKKAYHLLEAKLTKEGMFEESRKRQLPYPPEKIGLITSSESAAYSDFIKVISARWPLIEIEFRDVLVQGEEAPEQIIRAVEQFGQQKHPPEVLVLIRGGGSPDDLACFNDERVVRAVASARIPALVAIGHERDVCLAERAADKRASTPSNAAELLVPGKSSVLEQLQATRSSLSKQMLDNISSELNQLSVYRGDIYKNLAWVYEGQLNYLHSAKQILSALNPQTILKRGFTLVRNNSGQIIKSTRQLKIGENVKLEFATTEAKARIIK